MATFYLVIVPQGVTPSWSRANIATNSGWTATTIAYHDADTDPGSGATYVFSPDASGLTAGTSYDAYAVWDDGTNTSNVVSQLGWSTASAGATYNDTLSESATLADSTSAANLLNALVSESVALSDSATVGATFARTLIESVTTAESASALMTFSGAISETVSLLDQLNTGNGSLYTEVLTASVALSDALTSTATLTGAVTESMALSDALNALATFQAILSEAVAAGDLVVTQADQATLPRKVLTARITALSFAARVEATALGARVQATSLSARLQ